MNILSKLLSPVRVFFFFLTFYNVVTGKFQIICVARFILRLDSCPNRCILGTNSNRSALIKFSSFSSHLKAPSANTSSRVPAMCRAPRMRVLQM